jgi:hypothetical protein
MVVDMSDGQRSTVSQLDANPSEASPLVLCLRDGDSTHL